MSGRMKNDGIVGLRGIDVVSDAENIKKLLKMPYSFKTPVSMIVHRVGQSILIDDMDLHRLSGLLTTNLCGPRGSSGFNQENEEWSWLKNFLYEIVLTSYESKEKALVRRNTSRNAIQERNLISKFLHRSLEDKSISHRPIVTESTSTDNSIKSILVPPDPELDLKPSDSLDEIHDNFNQVNIDAVCGNDVSDMRLQLPPLPEPTPDDLIVPGGAGRMQQGPTSKTNESSQQIPKDFARNLLWNFEDIRMLIGSDMPIFGDKDHPSVSLRLHNVQKPIHILTGLDYWLDNLMCQVPEVLMCFHLNGIVQKYELVKTEELPSITEGGTFSPGVIRDVAQNILSFLKTHAAKEGHTYWLFKGKMAVIS